MLNKLKKEIEKNNFIYFKNIEIKYDELIVSANKFAGYATIKELLTISLLIDENIYTIEHLNDNVIKVKLK